MGATPWAPITDPLAAAYLACVGHRIRASRQLAGLSQPALGALVGVGESVVSQWERGIKEPRLGHRLALAAVLNVAPDDLFAYRDPRGSDR